MAATAAREAKHSEGKLKAYPVAASTAIFKGTLVGTNASGYLRPMADAASLRYVGVAYEGAANGSGSNGDLTCRVYKEGEFEFAYLGADATQARVGDEVYAQDDQTVDEDAALTTNDWKVGTVAEVVSASKVRVRIDNYVK